MTTISAIKISKRYGYHWIVKDFNHAFNNGIMYGIAGNNGSGKSTLIKILSGYLTPSAGTLSYQIGNKIVKSEDIFKFIALAAPYTDLINEYTLEEMFEFHQKFKPFSHKISPGVTKPFLSLRS